MISYFKVITNDDIKLNDQKSYQNQNGSAHILTEIVRLLKTFKQFFPPSF